ncbi:MAG TPA: S41 family peptidase [Anaerolineae bacterium]|nr:S41 family peptidase [Anaerolineae bacterium]
MPLYRLSKFRLPGKGQSASDGAVIQATSATPAPFQVPIHGGTYNMPSSDFESMRKDVILEIIRLTEEKYVYPDAGKKIAAHIQKKLEGGEYDDIATEQALASQLTTDLRSISGDHHWSVRYDPKGAATSVDPENEPDEDRMARYLEASRKKNFGFERVERLKGNIGYIDLRYLHPSEHAGETAVAAMQFVAHCDTLIIDLRQNHGGYPSMEQLLASYLFDSEPRLFNTFYYRPTDDTQQFWTFPHVPGRRRPDIPLYLLISGDTGSGAEAFAYSLKYMGRATLIGETTKGAAHPVTKEIVQGVFDVRLPYGRPINPVTGTNWEGKGVEPHIAVPADEALKIAHLHAMENLFEGCQDDDEKASLMWAMEIIESEYSPTVLDETALSRFEGAYEMLRFFVRDGDLFYGHAEIPDAWKLIPISETRFRLDEDMKFEFVLDPSDQVCAVRTTFVDGRPERHTEKTEPDPG